MQGPWPRPLGVPIDGRSSEGTRTDRSSVRPQGRHRGVGLSPLNGSAAATALAGCSSRDGPTPHKSAVAQALRAPASGDASVSAVEISVGVNRSLTIGPGHRPAKTAVPGVPDSAPGAWAWTGGPQDFVS